MKKTEESAEDLKAKLNKEQQYRMNIAIRELNEWKVRNGAVITVQGNEPVIQLMEL